MQQRWCQVQNDSSRRAGPACITGNVSLWACGAVGLCCLLRLAWPPVAVRPLTPPVGKRTTIGELGPKYNAFPYIQPPSELSQPRIYDKTSYQLAPLAVDLGMKTFEWKSLNSPNNDSCKTDFTSCYIKHLGMPQTKDQLAGSVSL